MTHKEALQHLIDALSSNVEADDDQILSVMIANGVPRSLADRTFKFTQIAYGRAFLEGIGVRTSENFLCFDRDGDIVESGKLKDDRSYMEAWESVGRNTGSPWFQRLALCSAEVQTINQALNNGSKPENLVSGPAGIFLEPATERGLHRASQKIHQRIMDACKESQSEPNVSENQHQKPRRPWWKFWE